MPNRDEALDFARARRVDRLDQYAELVGVPSISALPERHDDVHAAANLLAERLKSLGLNGVRVYETDGMPVVYAEWLNAREKPTVLVYGHYDVQPVDPIDEWDSAPFEPAVTGDYMSGRGAADMKGALWAFLLAVEAFMQQDGPPVNLKFLLEGEEEIGSPNMPTFLDEHNKLVSADVVVNLDGGMHTPDQPSITYALRGLAYFEIQVSGPTHDLHSGVFGGSVHNPIQVLCELIAGMHDADGRITLPGFYDKVRPLPLEERQTLARLPQSEEDWARTAGVPALWGERGYSSIERVGARPSLDVNGIYGGFTGQGAKTVLPAKATAKVSTRLVPDQDPADIGEQLREYMGTNAPETVSWEVRQLASGPGAVMDRNSPYMNAACGALETAFGKPPVFKREGGSVPVVGLIQDKLGIDSIMLGFCLPDSGLHGPNERQHLPTLFAGIETYVHFLSNVGEAQPAEEPT